MKTENDKRSEGCAAAILRPMNVREFWSTKILDDTSPRM